MIDYNLILDHFISAAKDAVGTELSTIGQVGFEQPAVIRARQGGPKPDYPYITIDVFNTELESGWLYNEYVDENENIVYATTKQLLLGYRVYGGNAISIANQLEGYFRQTHVLGNVRSTTGGSVVEIRDIDQQPVELADKWLESSSFNVLFNIIDNYIAPNNGDGVFDTVSLDGELFDNEQDTDPLDININVGPPTP